MKTRKFRRFKSEAGASLVEYGLIVALIAVVAVPATEFVGEYSRAPMCPVAIAIKDGSVGADHLTQGAGFYNNQGQSGTKSCLVHPSGGPQFWVW